MDVLHDRCAGLDIGKRDLKACLRTPSSTGRSRRQEIRTFATTTNALLELRDWLVEQRVTLVVLEATGDVVLEVPHLAPEAQERLALGPERRRKLEDRRLGTNERMMLNQLPNWSDSI